MLSRLAAAFCLLTTASLAQTDCGGAENPCRIEDGTYHVALPETHEGAPMLVFLHGYAGSGAAVVERAALREPALAAGMALIAPTGQPDPVQTRNLDWGVRDGFPWARDDVDFVARVVADAAQRFGLDSGRVLVGGYSRGGSMVWDIACQRPDLASAYAAASGAFWEPMIAWCQGPVHLYHSHGLADRTVPFEGKVLTWHGVPFEMGDVMKGLRVWQAALGCPKAANAAKSAGGVATKRWTKCQAGSLTLALTQGGHGRDPDWLPRVLDWFEATVPVD